MLDRIPAHDLAQKCLPAHDGFLIIPTNRFALFLQFSRVPG
jgi:hypothetical protein